ncbi:hypothetical protein [Sphaerisporangium dianthi]|uniref:Transcriptional regulator n=1 Tax=Sphaerisporangium dianthi TaxID=1436120 RepID=A0ABV9CG52_9ACTN
MNHVPARRLETVLGDLARERATGSLKVGRAGTVYLAGGRVTYVESPSAPGVEKILVASGRVSASALRVARRPGTANRPGERLAKPPGDGVTERSCGVTGDAGDALLRRGLLTRGELELCVLGAILDAAFFVLAATGTRHRFKEGDRHPFGDRWYFDVAGLFREYGRRRVQLDRAWPYPELDSLPVVITPRITAQRVVLTPVQWEVLLNADGTATPLDLARRIGRPAYSVLLAVRQFGAAGLLLAPGNAAPLPPGTSADGAAPALPPTTSSTTGSSTAVTSSPSAASSPALPKRTAHAGLRPDAAPHTAGPGPEAPPGTGLPPVSGDPADISMLIKLRDALERL